MMSFVSIWLRPRWPRKSCRLEERIAGPVAIEAGQVVRMIENGMTIAREMARGLTLILSGDDNLRVALEELAMKTRDRFGVECLLNSGDAQLSLDDFRAIHLYRIAQEAINNAIRHGKAARLIVTLSRVGDWGILTVPITAPESRIESAAFSTNGLQT